MFSFDPAQPAGRLLRRAWQPVSRSVDLGPGGLLPIHCLGEEWLLWRDEGGAAHLAAPRCPHRGTRLVVGAVCGQRLVCHHHGWAFGPDGSGPAPLAHRPIHERGGLVFAWFGADPPGPPPDLPALDGPLRVLPPERWPCSFFARLQNSLDIAHVAHAHRRSGLAPLLAQGWTAATTPTAEGFVLHVRAGDQDLPPITFAGPNRLEFFTPLDADRGWARHLVWRVPEGPQSCRSFTVAVLPAAEPPPTPRADPFAPSPVALAGEALLAGRLRWEALQTAHLTEVEDYVALCGADPDPALRDDEPGLAALLRWWTAALAAG